MVSKCFNSNFQEIITDHNFFGLKQLILKAAFYGVFSDKTTVTIENSVTDLHKNKFRNLPAGWKWIEIKNLADPSHKYPVGDGDHGLIKPRDYEDNGIPYIRVKDIVNDELNLSVVKHISLETHCKSLKSELHPNDVLIAKTGATLGKCCIMPENIDVANTTSSVAKVSLDPKKILVKYFYYYVLTSEFQKQIWSYSHKTAQPGFNIKDLKVFKIPVAPIEKQKIIVHKIEKLFDQYLSLKTEYEKKREIHRNLVKIVFSSENADDFLKSNFKHIINKKTHVDFLRDYIVKKAVSGRLVSQEKNSTSMEYFLEQCKVKKKKNKNEKKMPQILSEEIPFKTPPGWIWTRLGEITSKIGSGKTPRGGKKIYESTGIPFIRSQNVWNTGLKLENVAHIPEEIHRQMQNTKVNPGDILLNITGASIGRTCIVPQTFNEGNVSQHVSIIRPIFSEITEFLHLFLLSPFIQKRIMDVQVGISREGLSKKNSRRFVIPLPPLSEQRKIIIKTSNLLNYCNHLECLLDAEKNHSSELMRILQNQIFNPKCE